MRKEADCAKQITGEVHVATREPRWGKDRILESLHCPQLDQGTETPQSPMGQQRNTFPTVACATKILSKGSL